MNVNLIKIDEASFQFQEDKCERISHNLFRQLLDYKEDKSEMDDTPKMVVFKTKEEYLQNAGKYDIDLMQDMFINPKGNIFCYLNMEKKQEAVKNASDVNKTEEKK